MFNARLIVFDPGKTTGCASVQVGDSFSDQTEHVVGQCLSIESVIDMLNEVKPDLVILENFRLYPWKAEAQSFSEMPSPVIIGAILGWAYTTETATCLQEPRERNIITDDMLKASGWWKRTKGMPHARDAARHLLKYAITFDIDYRKELFREVTK